MVFNKPPLGLKVIGLVEIIIGIVTLLGLLASLVFSFSAKPAAVFIFVFTTSCISFCLGVGLLCLSGLARTLLLFFAGYVVITKLLSAAGLLVLTGQLETLIPVAVKNIVSVIYHTFVLWYLNSSGIKNLFKQIPSK